MSEVECQREYASHNSIHVQVEIVKLDTIGVRIGHVDRHCDFIAGGIRYLRLLRLNNWQNCTKGIMIGGVGQFRVYAPILGYFLLSQRKRAGTP